jgi:hypothetical protein
MVQNQVESIWFHYERAYAALTATRASATSSETCVVRPTSIRLTRVAPSQCATVDPIEHDRCPSHDNRQVDPYASRIGPRTP